MNDMKRTLKIKNVDKMAVRTRNSKLKKHTEEIVKLYLEGASFTQLAIKFDASRTAIATVVKVGAEQIRNQSESSLLRYEKSTPEQRKAQTLVARTVYRAISVIEKFSW